MYDELKERCRACSQGCTYPSECSYFDKPPLRCMRQLLSESADAIEELSRDLDSMNEANIALYGALPKWIPVTELLPEERQDVLVALRRGEIAVDYYQPNRWGYRDVTHWMPLPQPPKAEEGET